MLYLFLRNDMMLFQLDTVNKRGQCVEVKDELCGTYILIMVLTKVTASTFNKNFI